MEAERRRDNSTELRLSTVSEGVTMNLVTQGGAVEEKCLFISSGIMQVCPLESLYLIPDIFNSLDSSFGGLE